LTVTKSAKVPLAAWLGSATALGLLVLAAYKVGPVQRLDATVLSRLAAHRASSAGALAGVIVHLADPLPLVVMLAGVCALALHRGRPRLAIGAVVIVAGANLTTQILKVVLAHPRYQPILGVHQLGPVAFPSGHATAAASIALAFVLVVPARLRPLAALAGTVLVLAIGISVLVLDWHFPSDVLGGILVAAGWAFAVLAGLRIAERPSSLPPARLANPSAISVK
jgi:membrane-associated phospholipid phosphatase